MAMSTTVQDTPEDVQVFLVHGDHEAVVSPYGASLRGYSVVGTGGDRQEIATHYAGARAGAGQSASQASAPAVGQKIGGQGDVLIPFPGRIRDGAYTFGGQSFQMDRNDHEGPNAIHGFLRSSVWKVEEKSSSSIRFSAAIHKSDYQGRGYPFSLQAEVSYRVDEGGLTCAFAITNTGDDPAPVAAGFHPYFTTGSPLIDEDDLQVPLSAVLEMDAGLIPTGKVLPVEGTSFDFRRVRSIGSTVFNTCFLQPQRDADGKLRIKLKGNGATVTVWMDSAFNYVVLYSGDPLPPEHRRRSLAIEPMTCGSDGFNHPEWGLAVLKPGERLAGEWGVSVSR